MKGARARASAVHCIPLCVWTGLVLLGLLAPRAHAAVAERCNAPQGQSAALHASFATSATDWPRPLDRIVSFDDGDIPLGAALNRIDASTGIHLSYSPQLVPLDRSVCLSFRGARLGDVLTQVLEGAGVAPVILGVDRVILAPARSATVADATPVRAGAAAQLERVVVTGSATGAPERASPFALSVVDGTRLPSPSVQGLAGALNGAVPGVWIWAQSPTSAIARYGGIRGASSFGVSTPKVYIDGIEVANPLVVTQLDPSSIERIEVIRGPQGAALYGSDAISGVVQIVTRHDGASINAPAGSLRVSGGGSASAYSDGAVATQEHGLSLRRGAAARTASLGLSFSTIGAFTPGAAARTLLASGSLRHVGSRLVLTGTTRLNATNAEIPASPLLRGLLGDSAHLAGTSSQRVRQLTIGGTATLQSSERWTHAFTSGLDSYRLSGLPSNSLPLPSSSDSALRAARGGADRVSFRLSSTRRFASPDSNGAVLTFGLEHSTARERTSGFGARLTSRPDGPPPDDGTAAPVPESNDPGAIVTTWWHNSGLVTQLQLAQGRRLFVTSGLRLERIAGPSTEAQLALLPLLGGAWVMDRGPLTLKARTSFGRGIRPARTVARGGTWMGARDDRALTNLAPERQSGIEAGLDALWGERFVLSITRFDQLASGLVQPVALLSRGNGGEGPGRGGQRVLYQLQNVGAIDNGGWEMQARSTVGALSIEATLSLVSSRVSRLAAGYSGDLREGDRMLEVPARMMGLIATWAGDRWSAGASVARAADWINYDKLALAQTIAVTSDGPLAPVGAALRAYWRTYEGTTRIGFRTAYELSTRSALTFSGENLLNRQVGEPDNVTVVPGRTLSLGLRSRF